MAPTTVESFLNPPNPLTKRDRSHRHSLSLSSASYFSVRFEPVLIPITLHSTTRRKSWTNISTIARNTITIINVSPKLGSRRLGTCFLSLDPIHCILFNSRMVVAVPAAFASSSAAKQDDDSDEHSDIDDVENDDDQKKSATWMVAADDVENEKKMISSSSDDIDQDVEVLLNATAAEEEEESQEEAAAANWNWRQIAVILSRKLVDSLKEYLISADNKSPEEVIKDIIVETFAYSSSSSSTPDHLIKDASKLEDFYLGIPYGALLSLGGFLSFMITGSISGIRFGVILGGTLLALSISSLRYSYATKTTTTRRRDQSSDPLQQQQQQAIMKLAQAAIAGIIFLRHLGLLFQRPSFPNSFTALISGGMVVFYLYMIMLDGGGLTVRKKITGPS